MTVMKTLSTILLLALSATAASAWEIVIPPQVISRLTHYPTWRTPVPGWDAEQVDAVTAFSVIGVLIGVYLAFRFEILGRPRHATTIQDTYRENSRLLSTVISYYLIATSLAVVGFFILDLGKVWSTVGALHNLLEVSTLLVMTFSRRPDGFKYLYGILFVYLVATEWICVVLPWPYDAIFFKFQGLATDIALVFNFYRLYVVNRDEPIRDDVTYDPSHVSEIEVFDETTPLVASKGPSYETAHPSRNPLARFLNRSENGHASNGHASNGHASNGHAPNGSPADAASGLHPATHEITQTASDIRLVVAAAAIHVLGNIIATLSDKLYPFLIFQFSYGVAYPIYGYYVARNPDNSRIRWFDVTFVSEGIVAIVSIALSGVIVGIGAFLTIMEYQPKKL